MPPHSSAAPPSPPPGIDAVVWDFDGVLNRNIVDGRFLWMQNFEQDIGIPVNEFASSVFTDKFRSVLKGELALGDHLTALLPRWRGSYQGDAETIIAYWFERDALLDEAALEVLRAWREKGVRQAIGTNNEPRRAAYIRDVMGLGREIEALFAAGEMGVAKPDGAFFEAIEIALGLPPERIMLIDDHAGNVAAAAARGWRGHHFTTLDGLTASLPHRL